MNSTVLFQKAENLFKAASAIYDSDKEKWQQMYNAAFTIRQTAIWMERVENQEAEIKELEEIAEWIAITEEQKDTMRQQEELRKGG